MDDHLFAIGAAKSTAQYTPTHLAVMHQFMRERYAAAEDDTWRDSYTRYGALGTIATC